MDGWMDGRMDGWTDGDEVINNIEKNWPALALPCSYSSSSFICSFLGGGAVSTAIRKKWIYGRLACCYITCSQGPCLSVRMDKTVNPRFFFFFFFFFFSFSFFFFSSFFFCFFFFFFFLSFFLLLLLLFLLLLLLVLVKPTRTMRRNTDGICVQRGQSSAARAERVG